MVFVSKSFSEIEDTRLPPDVSVVVSNIHNELIEKGFIASLECPYGQDLINTIQKSMINTYLSYLDNI